MSTKTCLLLLVGLASIGGPTIRADAPPAVQPRVKVYSPNRHFFALSSLPEHRTAIFKASSPRTPLWQMEEYFPVFFLADDGNHLVEGYRGGNLLDAHVRLDEIFLTFFVQSKQVGSVSVGDLFPHLDQLPHTASHIAWGNFWGFDTARHFVLLLQDGRKITFDTDTGKLANPAP